MSEHEVDWDVVIVGRSYAGLSAAVMLGRARKATLVIGEGGPRNEAVLHSNGLPGSDHTAPGELIGRVERDLERYETVQLVAERVHELRPLGEAAGFHVRFGAAVTTARHVILATGVNDTPPPVPGLAERWGRGVYTCPFCDGFEHADQPWVWIGAGGTEHDDAARFRSVAANWTDDLTIVDEADVRRIDGGGGDSLLVELHDGRRLRVGAVFVAPCHRPNHQLAVALGAALDPLGYVAVDALRQTSVPGLLAVGDVSGPRHQVAFAMADGLAAAATVCHP